MNHKNTDTLLATAVDKTGTSIQVYLAQSLSGSKMALPYFLKNYADLIEQGYSNPLLIGSNKTKSVYAVIDDQIVGAIIFEIQDDVVNKTTWILLSAVSKEFRRRGIFKIMHNYVEGYGKASGSKLIASMIHIDNKDALASSASVGRFPVFYKTEKSI
jgi:hypothetical protein